MRNGRVVPVISSNTTKPFSERFDLKGRFSLSGCEFYNSYQFLTSLKTSDLSRILSEIRDNYKLRDVVVIVEAVSLVKLLTKPKVYAVAVIYSFAGFSSLTSQSQECLRGLEADEVESLEFSAVENEQNERRVRSLMLDISFSKGVYFTTSKEVVKSIHGVKTKSPEFGDGDTVTDVLDLMQLEVIQS